MEKTFIEDLWEKKPKLVIMAINKICNINEKNGDRLFFEGIEDGVLKFKKYGHVPTFIEASDFSLRTTYSGADYENSPLSIKWAKFMYKVCGDTYALQYISHRNKQLDKFMAEYEEKYNNETRKMLNEIGFSSKKGLTK